LLSRTDRSPQLEGGCAVSTLLSFFGISSHPFPLFLCSPGRREFFFHQRRYSPPPISPGLLAGTRSSPVMIVWEFALFLLIPEHSAPRTTPFGFRHTLGPPPSPTCFYGELFSSLEVRVHDKSCPPLFPICHFSRFYTQWSRFSTTLSLPVPSFYLLGTDSFSPFLLLRLALGCPHQDLHFFVSPTPGFFLPFFRAFGLGGACHALFFPSILLWFYNCPSVMSFLKASSSLAFAGAGSVFFVKSSYCGGLPCFFYTPFWSLVFLQVLLNFFFLPRHVPKEAFPPLPIRKTLYHHAETIFVGAGWTGLTLATIIRVSLPITVFFAR